MSGERCHNEHTIGFTGKPLGRNESGAPWEPCDSLTVDETTFPQFRKCVHCTHVASRHRARGEDWPCSDCPCPDYVDADPARWFGPNVNGGDPCCRHCAHGAGYEHPADSHCAVCFPNERDREMFALFQAACAVEGIEVPSS